jgi:SagB-type dehydrogenase family enzyme
MKKIVTLLVFIGCIMNVNAQSLQPIKLSKPNLKGGKSMMESFQDRRSDREYSSKNLSIDDISNLLWAACGINRPDGKRTSPTARNCQEIDVYLINQYGAYLYVPAEDSLRPIYVGDLRSAVAAGQDFASAAPISLVIVGDISKLGGDNDRAMRIMCCDAGIVSQSINIFCAGHNLATVTRATMNEKVLREALKLKDSQHLILNNPVGYKK